MLGATINGSIMVTATIGIKGESKNNIAQTQQPMTQSKRAVRESSAVCLCLTARVNGVSAPLDLKPNPVLWPQGRTKLELQHLILASLILCKLQRGQDLGQAQHSLKQSELVANAVARAYAKGQEGVRVASFALWVVW